MNIKCITLFVSSHVHRNGVHLISPLCINSIDFRFVWSIDCSTQISSIINIVHTNESIFYSLRLKCFFLSHFSEYVIAFLGSIEAGLICSTVNPSYTSEEISRQLISCQPKVMFCLVDNVNVVRRACVLAKQPDIKVITIQHQADTDTVDTISFKELMSTTGKQIYTKPKTM